MNFENGAVTEFNLDRCISRKDKTTNFILKSATDVGKVWAKTVREYFAKFPLILGVPLAIHLPPPTIHHRHSFITFL